MVHAVTCRAPDMALEHFPMASASVIRFTSPAMVVVLARVVRSAPVPHAARGPRDCAGVLTRTCSSLCHGVHHASPLQLYKEPFGWTEGVSTIVSTVGVVFVAQVRLLPP